MIIAEMCYALKDNIHLNLNQLEIPCVAILSPSLCGSDVNLISILMMAQAVKMQ